MPNLTSEQLADFVRTVLIKKAQEAEPNKRDITDIQFFINKAYFDWILHARQDASAAGISGPDFMGAFLDSIVIILAQELSRMSRPGMELEFAMQSCDFIKQEILKNVLLTKMLGTPDAPSA